jgi:hypothetical protein
MAFSLDRIEVNRLWLASASSNNSSIRERGMLAGCDSEKHLSTWFHCEIFMQICRGKTTGVLARNTSLMASLEEDKAKLTNKIES